MVSRNSKEPSGYPQDMVDVLGNPYHPLNIPSPTTPLFNSLTPKARDEVQSLYTLHPKNPNQPDTTCSKHVLLTIIAKQQLQMKRTVKARNPTKNPY